MSERDGRYAVSVLRPKWGFLWRITEDLFWSYQVLAPTEESPLAYGFLVSDPIYTVRSGSVGTSGWDYLLLVASADPAKTAVNFGRLNWAVSAAWPLIEQNFKLKDYRVRIRPDFLRQSPEVFLEAAATLTVGQILALGARLLPKLMPILTQKDKSGSKTRQQSQKEAV